MPRYQIIYSRKIMLKLVERGFIPIQTMPNPYKKNFQCWVFEATDDFIEAREELLGGRRK